MGACNSVRRMTTPDVRGIDVRPNDRPWVDRCQVDRCRVDLRLGIALVGATMFHGGLLVSGSFRTTYDAYVHLFFADHYRRSWFSSWDPRWYTGFTTVSYPPGGHQLLALGSKVFSNGTAFVPVMLGGVLLLVIGVYRFSRLWVSDRAAGYAAMLAAVSSAIAETVHVFGQLPTILSLGMLLNALPFGYRWISTGGVGALAAAVICSAGTTAMHHVTTLFGSVFFLGPVVALALLERFRTPLPDEPEGHVARVAPRTVWPLIARRLRRVLPALARTAVYGFLVVLGLVLVVLPYWLWSSSDPITQIPIPHASRDSFIENTNAGLIFWLVPWGLMLVVLPYALVRGAMGRTWPLAASLGLLALLGTGGTTPVPRMLLGPAFDILTLDRFTFWATIMILPYAGRFTESLVHGRLRSVATAHFGARFTTSVTAALGLAIVAVAIFCANLTAYRPFQPAAIDMDPIVAFMDKDQHDRWRYLTLGFGDQMAYLAAQTEAESVDGNYHSARRLPELTSTPVERLEGAKYSGVPGLGSLQQFLAVPEKYHLKFVYSNDQFYDPLLAASGWQRLTPLENGIAVWQHEDVEPLPAGRLRPELPLWQRLMWGVLPLVAMISAWLVLLAHWWGVEFGRRRLPLPRPIGSIFTGVDRRLYRSSLRLRPTEQRERWQPFGSVRERLATRVTAPVRVGRRRLQMAVALAALLVVGVLVTGRAIEPPTPSDTVFAYYDALDLRRLDVAYEMLDPNARPSRTQFVTERSVVNGLVASYARLDRIDPLSAEVDGSSASVRSRLVYITALDEHVVETVDELTLVDGRWRVVPSAVDIRIPPDQLVARSSVDYLSQGRRQVTDGPTAYQDVIDRPEIRILSGRLVRAQGQLAVVGEIRNDDVDPGYVTVSAELVGHDGTILTEYTAAVGAVHTALPGETVPFRIDFEGVAGLIEVIDPTDGSAQNEATRVDFEPGARSPLALDTDLIAEVRISAKAVVTGDDLERTVAAQDVVFDGRAMTGELRNDGVDEVTVPHVFVTLRDVDGRVGWVSDVFLSEAVRPQRSQRFEIVVPAIADIDVIDVPVHYYANSLVVDTATGLNPLFADVGGWAGVDVMVVGFTRPAS